MDELLQEDYELNVYEQRSFRKSAKNDETGVHGDILARDSFVEVALLEVESMERLRGNLRFGKGHRSMQVDHHSLVVAMSHKRQSGDFRGTRPD